MSEQLSIAVLTSQYLDGTISPENAKILTDLVKSDKTAESHVLASLVTELLLCELYQKSEQQESRELHSLALDTLAKNASEVLVSVTGTIATGTDSDADAYTTAVEPDWDELIRLQNAERPIAAMVDEFRALREEQKLSRQVWRKVGRFAKKCFWPSRADYEESVAPVVTAITVFLVLATTIIIFVGKAMTRGPADPITTMARVNETIDVIWEKDAEEYKSGQLIDESHFQIKSGLVQLEMKNGTTLVLEGPVDLSVNSAMTAMCQSGKISVHVPKAGHGYKITTPYGSVVDRGTDFFVDVVKDVTQVEVKKGKIDFFTSGEDFFSLLANEYIQYGLSIPPVKKVFSAHSNYISTAEFQSQLDAWGKELQTEKIAVDSQVDDISGLVTRLEFSQIVNKRFTNYASNSLGPTTVQVLGTEEDNGPIPGTTARKFTKHNDAITGDFSAGYKSMTFVARVRLKSLEQTTNVIYASDEFRGMPGTILWQVLTTGAVQFHITPQNSDELTEYTSPVVFSRKNINVWVTVAVVANAQAKTIQFFVDGNLRGEVPWPNPVKIDPGRGSIGNFLGAAKGVQMRNFNGAISEFMIFDRPLKRNELAQNMFRGTGVERPSSHNNQKEKEQ
ncbi:MAG: LamG-like jellyroll fold domain-containing protein [Planctomycetia bacterium]|nr:LamG-like jellyroll fold domain-containing protein [Planctomycetia bacterium]